MELMEAIQEIALRAQEASQPTQLQMGTVTRAKPLEITVHGGMAPLTGATLCLTRSVLEQRLPILEHTHKISDTYTGGGSCENALLTGEIVAEENKMTLPVREGYILLNRGLEEGDKVLLLRMQGGQRFVVLSRLVEGGE